MSHDEMDKLHLRLDKIYTDIFNDAQERERKHTEAHEKMFKEMSDIRKTLTPIASMFSSVQGFNGVSVWILKGLALVGAGLGVVYAGIQWLKH